MRYGNRRHFPSPVRIPQCACLFLLMSGLCGRFFRITLKHFAEK
jgi:hypothetical protein